MKKLFLTLVLLPSLAFAHGGGLDSSGCHTNHRTGDYHCHQAWKALGSALGSVASSALGWAWDTAFGSSEPSNTRDPANRRAFHSSHPCPSTGLTSGPCPGYHVDHIVPLACGGSDSPTNMQWLSAEENLSKGSMGCRY